MNPTRSKEKSDRTIEHILAASRKTFADNGFAGARMDEIARRAKVNKATIYYHIGDKRTLYERILKHIFGDIADNLLANDQKGCRPDERLRLFVRTLARLVDRNTDLAAIMLREQASGARDFPEIVARDFSRILGLMADILNDGVNAGMFKQTKPVIVHLMIIGALVFTKMSSPIRSKLAAQVAAFDTIGSRLDHGAAGEIEALVLDAVRR